ncbi:unnamed protein product [Didymodactylos carnosus]|uniref:Transposase n=1 Tax=Didymodactylos carnosus TaxID=1234261 RepID=A0A814REU4_9BILA|nr:unnamed protein product [Didymodactylos carnosus]CAF3895063.1 unnamed protein product [Didymodactylos carnosus]
MADGTRKKTLKDGTVKIYPTMRCTNRQCRNQLSVRKNTFFAFIDALGRPNSKLDIRTILELIWLWCLGTSSSTIATCHGNDCGRLNKRFARKKLNDAPQMGGIGEVVQIDESLFRDKRKSLDIRNCAANGRGIRGSFFHVRRRDAATLLPIIWKNVYPGTTIWSDE